MEKFTNENPIEQPQPATKEKLEDNVAKAKSAYDFIMNRIEEIKETKEENSERKLGNLEKMRQISFDNWQRAKQIFENTSQQEGLPKEEKLAA